MKQCPKCQHLYSDTDLNFCLSDGTPLTEAVAQSSVETVIRLPEPYPLGDSAPKGVNPVYKYFSLFSIGLVALIGVAGIAYWFGSRSVSVQIPADGSNVTPSPQVRPSEEPSVLMANSANTGKDKTQLAQENRVLLNPQSGANAQNSNAVPPRPTSLDPLTSRIKFRRGSVREVVSGLLPIRGRTFLIQTRGGQVLSAKITSPSGCVLFANRRTILEYTTTKGDQEIRLFNECGGDSAFTFDVTIL